MLRLAIVMAGLVLLVGCGSEEDGEESPGSSSAPATELTVTVWPKGPDGPKRERRVECPGASVCGELSAQRFAPVPRDMACTAIYGCQINRWEQNRELLGPPNRGQTP